MTLENIFTLYGIQLKTNNEYRHIVDILEDIYLKLSVDEYKKLLQDISQVESTENFIFDQARNRPYQ